MLVDPIQSIVATPFRAKRLKQFFDDVDHGLVPNDFQLFSFYLTGSGKRNIKKNLKAKNNKKKPIFTAILD